MEAGNRAAGDGGKQNGEHGGGVVGGIQDRQAAHGGVAHQNRDDCQRQHCVQQEGGQVVTGLQQNPHGSNGGHGDVNAHDPHPGLAGQINGMEIHADGDDGDNAQNADNGSGAHGNIAAVNGKAEDNGDDNEQQGDHGNPGVCLRSSQIHSAVHKGCGEGAGNDGGKGCNHQNQRQVGEDDKQALGTLAHVGGNDFADGLAAVTDGGKQGAEVMDTAEENAADDDPQGAGTPAEAGSYSADGTGNGACTGDGGEVMAHQDRRGGGDVVNTIFHGVRGGRLVILTDTPLLAQVAAIENIAGQEADGADDQKQNTVHIVNSLL